MWIGLHEVDSNYTGDSGEVLSAVIIIVQSDMKYLMKVNMEQLFYESCVGGMIEILFTMSIVRYFFRCSCFEGQLLFGKNYFFWKTSFSKSLLAFITFKNYERVNLVEGFLHIFCLCFVFRNIIKKEKKQKTNLLK